MNWLSKLKWSNIKRFLKRYWWAFPAWLIVKWSTIFLVGYFTVDQFTGDGEEHQDAAQPEVTQSIDNSLPG